MRIKYNEKLHNKEIAKLREWRLKGIHPLL